MEIRPLAIDGAFEITPQLHRDDRGVFLEWFRADRFRDAVGHDLDLAQANCSVSAGGVIRGIHYSEVPPGQAKYITCVAGAIFDVAVDLRVGSPTFGRWDSVLLDDVDRRGMYIAEGLGHAFMSVAERSTIVYLCSSLYAPAIDQVVNPLDEGIGIAWPSSAPDGRPLTISMSARDAAAVTLEDARRAGRLPLASVAR